MSHSTEHVTRNADGPRPVTPLGILSEKLQRLGGLLYAGATIDHELIDQLNQATQLAIGLDRYVGQCTTPQSDDLASLAKATAAENWVGQFSEGQTEVLLEQEMLSGHVEGQFLKLLVAATGATRVLEIGMFTGYSALAIAEGLPEDGQVVACELDAFAAKLAQDQFDGSRHGKKIEVRVGPASQTLHNLAIEKQQFDFVFIDADKPGYAGYFQQLIDLNLLSSGALICVDNTLLQGEPYLDADRSASGQAIAEFNQLLAEDDRVEQVLVPLRDGITMIRLIKKDQSDGVAT